MGYKRVTAFFAPMNEAQRVNADQNFALLHKAVECCDRTQRHAPDVWH